MVPLPRNLITADETRNVGLVLFIESMVDLLVALYTLFLLHVCQCQPRSAHEFAIMYRINTRIFLNDL